MITAMVMELVTSGKASDAQFLQLLLGSISDALWCLVLFKSMR